MSTTALMNPAHPPAATGTNGGVSTAIGEEATKTRKTTMHKLIEEHGIVLMPGVYDALSASILQKAGFHAGFISGYSVSASHLGMPDIGLLTYYFFTLSINIVPPLLLLDLSIDHQISYLIFFYL